MYYQIESAHRSEEDQWKSIISMLKTQSTKYTAKILKISVEKKVNLWKNYSWISLSC